MRHSAALRLEPVTSTNWREGLAVRAQEGQARFVADYQPVLLVILAKTAVRVGGVQWWPFLLKDHASTVGVVAVADHREHHSRALMIFHLLIDERHQRRGYGRAALQQIIELGRQADGCDMLQLTVDPHNAAAIALYESAGFEVTGTDDDGELQMAKPLSPVASS
jgi:diamine N-acetyltransferase